MTIIDAFVYLFFITSVIGLLITIVVKGYKEFNYEIKERKNESST